MRKVLFIPIRGTKYHVAASVKDGIESITYPTFPGGLNLPKVRLIASALMQAANWCGSYGGHGKSQGKDTGWFILDGDDPDIIRRKLVFPTDIILCNAKRSRFGWGVYGNPYMTLEELREYSHVPQRYIAVDSPAACQVALTLDIMAKACQPWRKGEW